MADRRAYNDGSPSEDIFEYLTFLRKPTDWERWSREIEGFSRAWGVWDYVNPDATELLEKPARPDLPPPPEIKEFPKRRPYELTEDFQVRFQEFKFDREFLNTEYAMYQERYRVDCQEYSIRLADYTKVMERLSQLNIAIYATCSGTWRDSITDHSTATPQSKLRKLRQSIRPVNHPVDDLLLVDLPIDLPTDRSVDHYEYPSFNQSFNPSSSTPSFNPSINPSFNPSVDPSVGPSDHQPADPPVDGPVDEPSDPSADQHGAQHGDQFGDSPVDSTSDLPVHPAVDPSINHSGASSVDAPIRARPPRRDTFKDLQLVAARTVTDWEAWTHDFVEAWGKCNWKYDPSVDVDARNLFLETVSKRSESFTDRWRERLPSRGTNPPRVPELAGDFRAMLQRDKTRSPSVRDSDGSEHIPKGVSQKRELEKSWRSKEVRKWPSESRSQSAADTQSQRSETRNKSEAEFRRCPGCHMQHSVKVGAWWESCFVYHQLSGKKEVPKFIYVTMASQVHVEDWFRKHPEESALADKWEPDEGMDTRRRKAIQDLDW